ncbi:MAG: TetR/AcrR family transcriptional regulator [Bacteroidales bacterium]|nr:TetR/AcrR family transcriptional regulator [Bacteroidales bacterium]
MDLRTRIMKEAGILFGKQGIRNVTMDYIAEELGISKRTIYENFKDKTDLLRQSVYEVSILHRELSLKVFNESENVIVGIYQLAEFMRMTMKKVNPLFFSDLKKYYPDIYRLFSEKSDIRNHSLTYTMLKKGVNEGIFRKDFNIELVNEAWQELISVVSDKNFQDRMEFSKQDVACSIFFPFLRGLCTEKGLEIVESNFEKLKSIHEGIDEKNR